MRDEREIFVSRKAFQLLPASSASSSTPRHCLAVGTKVIPVWGGEGGGRGWSSRGAAFHWGISLEEAAQAEGMMAGGGSELEEGAQLCSCASTYFLEVPWTAS